MSSRPSYQLTDYSVGSLREVWSISWPLMLGLLSSSLMMFADRLYLAHYSVVSMSAMAVGGLYAFLILLLPLGICQITEVFVGRAHGKEAHDEAGRPVWQVLWIALALAPLLAAASRLTAWLLFSAGAEEVLYLVTLVDFGSFLLASISLMGFFIGIGKTKVITYATLLANLVNLLLAPLFIFGSSFTPEMGVKGAAIATGLAQGIQALFLFFLFLRKPLRDKFQTFRWKFSKTLTKEILSLALPSCLGRMIEMVAHTFFFRIMTLAGPEQLTLSIMIQNFLLLSFFCVDGLAKGVTTLVSNLVGAKKYGAISAVLSSAFKVHTLISLALFVFCFFGCDWIYSSILNGPERALLQDPQFHASLKLGLIWLALFFLVDGFSWILSGQLTAIGDTRFLLLVNALGQWITYLIPLYFLVTLAGCGAVTGWAVIACNALVLFAVFKWRSLSKERELTLLSNP